MPLDWISGVGTSQVGNTHALNSEGGGSSQPTGSQSAAGGNPNAIVVLSNTQQSSISSRKRNSTDDVSSIQSRKNISLPTSQKTISIFELMHLVFGI